MCWIEMNLRSFLNKWYCYQIPVMLKNNTYTSKMYIIFNISLWLYITVFCVFYHFWDFIQTKLVCIFRKYLFLSCDKNLDKGNRIFLHKLWYFFFKTICVWQWNYIQHQHTFPSEVISAPLLKVRLESELKE